MINKLHVTSEEYRERKLIVIIVIFDKIKQNVDEYLLIMIPSTGLWSSFLQAYKLFLSPMNTLIHFSILMFYSLKAF